MSAPVVLVATGCRPGEGSSVASVVALTIGPANAWLIVGCDWEWVADTARRLGVRFLGSQKKRVVVASEFLHALTLERERPAPKSPSVPTAADPISDADAADVVLRMIGKKRRRA